MRIVLDTNVLVSGLRSPGGPPGRILDLITLGRVVVIYDDRIIAEYRDVLARPKLRLEPVETEAILELIERDGILLAAPPLAIEIPDPKDLPFLEVAVAGHADALVTGNHRDFVPARASVSVPILAPVAFLARWLAEFGDQDLQPRPSPPA